MTKREERLMIYADLLEQVIYSAMDIEKANKIIRRINESVDRLCLNDITKELINQCEQN